MKPDNILNKINKADKVMLFNPSVGIYLKISKADMRKVYNDDYVQNWNYVSFKKGIICFSRGNFINTRRYK